MKKVLLFSIFSAASICFGEAVVVGSQNVVGIQRTVGSSGEMIVPQPFVGYSATGADTTSTLADLLYTDNLSLTDEVMVLLNAKDKYFDEWMWLPGISTNLYPSARDNVTPAAAADEFIPRGVGLKMRLQKTGTPVYVVGQSVNTNETTTLKLASRKLTLITNSFGRDLNLNEIFTPANGATSRDQLQLTLANGQTASYRLSQRADSQNRYWALQQQKSDGTAAGIMVDLIIKPGESFYYGYAGSASELEIQL